MTNDQRADLDQSVVGQLRTDILRLTYDQTVGEALAELRASKFDGQVVYFYVVDMQQRLQGVLSARALLLSTPETPLVDIMQRGVVTLPDSASMLDACEMFILHRLLALPVVDAQGRLLGIIEVGQYADRMVDLASREASDDLFSLIGVRLAQMRKASIWGGYRQRFPWLLSNIAGGLICAFLAGFFEHVLQQVIVLAMFLPVVLALAESVSIQSLSLHLQSQVGGVSAWRTVARGLGRELGVGLLLGLSAGAIIGGVGWLWLGKPLVMVCLMTTVALAVTTSAAIGMAVPAVLEVSRYDAKVASGPVGLALADVSTLFYLFGLASWWLI